MIISKKIMKKLSAAADPTRVKVLVMLNSGPVYVSNIVKRMKIEPTLLSHHLSVLKKAGLVESRRDGKKVIYRKMGGTISEDQLRAVFN